MDWGQAQAKQQKQQVAVHARPALIVQLGQLTAQTAWQDHTVVLHWHRPALHALTVHIILDQDNLSVLIVPWEISD